LNETTLEEMRKTIPEATEEFLTLFSPENSVAKREITGATGPKAVAAQIEFWKKELA
jgi:argininosuccinate lyase